MEFGVHLVETHMRKTDLTVMYTNGPVMVEDSMNTMKRLFVEDDNYKMLCIHHHVLLDHYCLATLPCEYFTKFVNNPDYRFATVDTTNDRKVLKTSSLAREQLVDIRGHYKIWVSKKDMDSHVDLDEASIDLYYGGLKTEYDKNKHVWHMAWVKRLDEHHLQTTAKEVYTCYEMFRQIIDMSSCLLREYVQGSSHKQSGGDKLHTK
ncbi:hypothetical protein D1007_17465 [Hordeum vulgare]|nr:hypothetical protein D1007_17465 [Hordeum vulgare]